jgi:hypothetical protein
MFSVNDLYLVHHMVNIAYIVNITNFLFRHKGAFAWTTIFFASDLPRVGPTAPKMCPSSAQNRSFNDIPGHSGVPYNLPE